MKRVVASAIPMPLHPGEARDPHHRHRCHSSHCHLCAPVGRATKTMRRVAPCTPKREARKSLPTIPLLRDRRVDEVVGIEAVVLGHFGGDLFDQILVECFLVAELDEQPFDLGVGDCGECRVVELVGLDL